MAEKIKDPSYSVPLLYGALLCAVVTGLALLFMIKTGLGRLHDNTIPPSYSISEAIYKIYSAESALGEHDERRLLRLGYAQAMLRQSAGNKYVAPYNKGLALEPKKQPLKAETTSFYNKSGINSSGSIPNRRSRQQTYRPIIVRAARQYSIDPALVQAIIFAESAYNPNAVSKKGAKGLMQLMPGTAKAMGVEDCFNPEHNIFGGVRYFKKLTNQFGGDTTLALAAYNAGGRHVRNYNGVPPFKATQYYVKKVLKYYEIYKNERVLDKERT
jgi:soluble lytic murein transglycosylase-like protein